MIARSIEHALPLAVAWRWRSTVPMSTLIGIAVGILGAGLIFALAVRLLTRRVGCACGICGNRMLFFDELVPDDQQEIVSYFKTYEDRRPDTKKLLACATCRIVYDEFSGERRKLDGDDYFYCKICNGIVMPLAEFIRDGKLKALVEANPRAADLDLECLRCERNPYYRDDCMACDTPRPVYACSGCPTLYTWITTPRGWFRFFAPLNNESVLHRVQELIEWDL